LKSKGISRAKEAASTPFISMDFISRLPLFPEKSAEFISVTAKLKALILSEKTVAPVLSLSVIS